MYLFRKKKPRVFGVVDVGSDAIKALIFAVSLPKLSLVERAAPAGQHPNGALLQQNSISATVRPIEKFVWELPESYTGARLAQKIRECVFSMVRRLEAVPERIIIALGPTVAECMLDTWRAAPAKRGWMLTRRDIDASYRDLFAREKDLRRAVIAVPVEVLVNGYPLARQRDGADEDILPHTRVEEVSFRMLSLYMAVENGTIFAEIKNVLGGMPVSFVPLAAVYREAIVFGLGVRDAFVVDIGGSETTLLSLRDGRFSHASFIPLGTRQFARDLAKSGAYSFHDAQKAMRLYAGALPGSAGDGGGGAAAAAAAAIAAGKWKASFVSAIGSFAAAGPLSPDLFLAGGGARFPDLRAVLLAPDWLGTVSYTVTPRLRVLEGSSFFGGDSFGGYLAGPEDAGLASIVVYSQVHRPFF